MLPDHILYSAYLSLPDTDAKKEMEEELCDSMGEIFSPAKAELASLLCRSILSGEFHSASSDMLDECDIDVFDSEDEMKEFSYAVIDKTLDGIASSLNIVTAKYTSKKIVNDSVVYEYSDKHLKDRLKRKRSAIKKLNSEISRIRKKYKKDLSSKDGKIKYTALAVAIIDEIHERVGDRGNDNTGVTSLKKKHVTVRGSKVSFNYTGKSGVKQSKSLNNSLVASTLKELLKDKKDSGFIFDIDGDDESYKIYAKDVNSYLSEFKVTAKDLRGYAANRLIYEELKRVRSGRLPSDEKDRAKQLKDELSEAISIVAEKVGHTESTCKNQYIMPEIIESFLIDGKVRKVAFSYDLIKTADIISEAGFRDWWRNLKDMLSGKKPIELDEESDYAEESPIDLNLEEEESIIIVLNKLNPEKESCEDCLAASEAGYIPITKMISVWGLPGNRKCRSNCGCEVITEDGRFYRSAKLKTKREIEDDDVEEKDKVDKGVGTVLRQNFDLGMSGRAPSTDDDEYNASPVPDPLEVKSPW